MKPKKILIMALFSGLITTIVFYLFINQLHPSAAEKVAMVSVVTANQDIEENQQITEENIALKEIPEEQVHPQAVKDKELIIGQFTDTTLKSGEVIMLHRLQKQEEEAEIISKKVKEGYRAVSISVDFVKSVSNLIEPGDHVDVVLTQAEETGEKAAVETEIVLEKVKVLAVGKRMIEKKEEELEEAAEYLAVTLELNQEDAVTAIDASGKGSLQLALHSKLLAAEETAASEAVPAEQAKSEIVNTGDSQVIALPERSLVRSAPALTAPITTVVESGTSLRYLGEEETDEDDRLWFRVETPDEKTGWISSRIIKYDNE